MRTTLTVDPDVWARLKELANERSVTFEEIVNATLRAGLAVETPDAKPFTVRARPMGARPGVDLSRALRLADELEDEALGRKPGLGK